MLVLLPLPEQEVVFCFTIRETHLTSCIVLGSLGKVCLTKELVTCHVQLDPVWEEQVVEQ